MTSIVSFILLLVVWPVDILTTIDAFSIDVNAMVLFHTNHFHPMIHYEGNHHHYHLQSISPPQQQRHEYIMIRSAVAYGRSDNDDDDSEWYHPPPSKHTVATEIDIDDDTTSVPSVSSLKSDVIESQYRHHGMYTVRYTTITSAHQFNDLFDVSSSLVADTITTTTTTNHSSGGINDNELIIVKFYASWCKSCQKVGYKIDQLISELSSTSGGVSDGGTTTTTTTTRRLIHIIQVDYSTITNRELFVQYNITQLPTIHLYTKRIMTVDMVLLEKVMGLPCPPHQFHKVRNRVLSYYKNLNQINPERSDKEGVSVFDFGHDMIESSVLPLLRATTKKNEKIM